MSESVACALEVLDCDQTRQTRVFIRMINRFFDCLNVKTHKTGLMKRNDALLPYRSQKDERFKVSTFLCVHDYYNYVNSVAHRSISQIP